MYTFYHIETILRLYKDPFGTVDTYTASPQESPNMASPQESPNMASPQESPNMASPQESPNMASPRESPQVVQVWQDQMDFESFIQEFSVSPLTKMFIYSVNWVK